MNSPQTQPKARARRRLRSVVGLTCDGCAHHYYSGKASKCEMWVQLAGGPPRPLRPRTAPACDRFAPYKPAEPNAPNQARSEAE